jgi:hypothetical protein
VIRSQSRAVARLSEAVRVDCLAASHGPQAHDTGRGRARWLFYS